MITDVDVKKLEKKFATKVDLELAKIDLREEMRQLGEKITHQITSFKDEILTSVDAVLKQFQDARIEQIVHSNDHVESTPTVAHELNKVSK